MDIQLGNSFGFVLLVIVGIAAVLALLAIVARSRLAARFATPNLRGLILPASSQLRHAVSAVLAIASLAFLALALLDIRWGKIEREVPQKGIEVIFALDVSRSMLAEDTSPSRLARAKQQIADMVDEMAGDRVGLVVFAGEAHHAVPLTSHYDDFQQVLQEVGPHSVRRGGSRLGDALEVAAEGFLSKTNDHKAIVVFTDGEDQESRPIELAQRLHEEQGVRIFAVGLGDMDQGARIPDAESRGTGFVEYEGRQVWSKLNGEVLNAIARATDGAYVPAGTKRVDMADVYHGYVANVPETEFETAKINAYGARFQWFAVPALVLLLAEIWISSRASKRGAKAGAGSMQAVRPATRQRADGQSNPHQAA